MVPRFTQPSSHVRVVPFLLLVPLVLMVLSSPVQADSGPFEMDQNINYEAGDYIAWQVDARGLMDGLGEAIDAEGYLGYSGVEVELAERYVEYHLRCKVGSKTYDCLQMRHSLAMEFTLNFDDPNATRTYRLEREDHETVRKFDHFVAKRQSNEVLTRHYRDGQGEYHVFHSTLFTTTEFSGLKTQNLKWPIQVGSEWTVSYDYAERYILEEFEDSELVLRKKDDRQGRKVIDFEITRSEQLETPTGLMDCLLREEKVRGEAGYFTSHYCKPGFPATGVEYDSRGLVVTRYIVEEYELQNPNGENRVTGEEEKSLWDKLTSSRWTMLWWIGGFFVLIQVMRWVVANADELEELAEDHVIPQLKDAADHLEGPAGVAIGVTEKVVGVGVRAVSEVAEAAEDLKEAVEDLDPRKKEEPEVETSGKDDQYIDEDITEAEEVEAEEVEDKDDDDNQRSRELYEESGGIIDLEPEPEKEDD